MKKILVTGAKGQLAKCIKDAAPQYPELDFQFADRDTLNIEEEASVELFFQNNNFDYCINAAAYTNVEQAESDKEAAFVTNAEGAKHLAKACAKSDTVLVHISTDYVFDGEQHIPYTEKDTTNPISVYGASKLKGEQYIQEICEKFFIFRTSWLYSQYGHNFLNSMLRYAEEKKGLTITTEQLGTPTNANDLATVLLSIINSRSDKYGLYHFSNEGSATWYDFAKAIFTFSEQIENVTLGKTDHYRTFAQRPAYSVLNKEKFMENFPNALIDWQVSLKQLIENHKNPK
jgi:dTDP-4-dehydrorhamnose reductase